MEMNNADPTSMMIMDEYVADESTKHKVANGNTPMLRRSISKGEVPCLPPI